MSFIFKITTTTSPQTFVIPCFNEGTFNATVNYGDGTGSQTVTAYNDSNLTHSFATAGQHTITIDGTFPNVRFYVNAASQVLVDEVVDLGDVNWTNLYQAFRDCSNLTAFNAGTTDTSSVTDMYQMFTNCSSLTSLDLSSFDTSSVSSMGLMFYRCSSLASLDLSGFDTSSVTNLSFMFYNCTSLTNLDIKHFNVSSVTSGTNFLIGSNNALTTTAYDELLEAWAVQDVQPNVTWHFGDAQYTVETITDWYSPRSASSLSIINNKLVSIADSTAVFGAGQQVDNLIVGNVYKMKARSTCNNAAATIFLSVSVDATLSPSVIYTQGTSTALIDNIFTATATTMYFGVIVNGHAANDTVTIDAGITVKEITNYTEATAASQVEYSQENVFGSEEVVNGDFSNGTVDWDALSSASLSVSQGALRITNVGANFGKATQQINTITGKAYELTFNGISRNIDSRVRVGTTPAGTNILSNLTWNIGYNRFVFITWTTVPYVTFVGDGVDGSFIEIDNVSVKEITNAVEYKNIPQSARELYTLEDDTWVGSEEVSNGDFSSSNGWTVGSSWTIGGGNATCNGAYTLLTTAVGDTASSSYKVKYTIENWSSGGIKTSVGGYDNTTYQTSNGTYTEIITASNPSSNTTFYVIPTSAVLSVDNISVKKVVEVADFVEPVTDGMTLTAAWTTRGTNYSTLQNATSVSVRVDATISNTDDGILMEAGADAVGLILYVYSGVLYFQCGNGGAYGTASDRAEVSYTLPVGESDYIIEWSADTSNAVLYVNGLVVGSQAFSEIFVAGTNGGTLGEVEESSAINRGGWTANGSGVYTNTITKCDIFNNQITSDV